MSRSVLNEVMCVLYISDLCCYYNLFYFIYIYFKKNDCEILVYQL